jgi:iron complex outermembrane receptor protein
VGLGYRVENYEIRDIFADNGLATITGSVNKRKSSSQYSFGLVYDVELGSSMYYRHSRTYRFPGFDDMINLGFAVYPPYSHPDPIWLLDPEEGTLEEVGIRHWFTRNIYAALTYYEMDMDNEIFYGPDSSLPPFFPYRNQNIPNTSHYGLEFDGLIRLTPRWSLRGTYTRQNVLFLSNWRTTDLSGRSTADKWMPLNPNEIGYLSLAYQNSDWGFSALFSYYYVGSRFFDGDIFNEMKPMEPAKWGDMAFSQTVFDDTTTIYFGVRNFTDRQYALSGNIFGLAGDFLRYSNAGRTYYAGVRSSLDFERMRLPSTADLQRMNRRLYGALRTGANVFTGMGSWMRNLIPFSR